MKSVYVGAGLVVFWCLAMIGTSVVKLDEAQAQGCRPGLSPLPPRPPIKHLVNLPEPKEDYMWVYTVHQDGYKNPFWMGELTLYHEDVRCQLKGMDQDGDPTYIIICDGFTVEAMIMQIKLYNERPIVQTFTEEEILEQMRKESIIRAIEREKEEADEKIRSDKDEG
jgi:hypothetical protein